MKQISRSQAMARTSLRPLGRPLGAVAAGLMLTLTLGACGGGDSEVKVTKKDSSESSSPKTSDEVKPTEDPTDEPTANDGDSSEALDELVDQTQGFVKNQMENFSDVYSDISVTADGSDTIVYSYTYVNEADAKTTADGIEAQTDSLQQTLDSQVFPSMRAAGIPSPKATYVYKNSDGSVIWEKTFSPS